MKNILNVTVTNYAEQPAIINAELAVKRLAVRVERLKALVKSGMSFRDAVKQINKESKIA